MLARDLKRVLPLVAATTVLLVSSSAFASGFAAARFGGERGNPTETNPTTLYYNPAGIGMSEGTNVFIDLNLALRSATYDRPVSALDNSEPYPDDEALNDEAIAVNTGDSSVDNLILSPMVGISTDFGLDLPFKVGAAFFAPFGGQAVWDKTESSDQFPGAVDGSQRWYTIDGTIRTLAVALGGAYHIEPARLSVGLVGNLYLSQIETLRARNSDGTDDLQSGGRLKEGRSYIDVNSTDIGLGAGVLWEAWRRKLFIGLSYQSQPGFTSSNEYEGTLTNYLGASPSTTSDVLFTSSLPDILRFGIRLRPQFKYELRVFGDWTRWSNLDQQCLVNADVDDRELACATNEDGSFANPDADTGRVVQVLQRDWQDGFGIRLGASYWFSRDLELQIGGGYDSNAIPDENLDPALMDMNKFSAALGVVYRPIDLLGVSVTATNIFYAERDTTSASDADNNDFELPSRQPGNVGIYNQNIFVLNTNVTLTF